MIIWRGNGWLTIVFFLLLIPGAAVFATLFGRGGIFPFFVFAAIVVVGNAMVGRKFNRPLELQGVPFSKRHSLFWIPMEWWSAVFVVYLVGVAVTLLRT